MKAVRIHKTGGPSALVLDEKVAVPDLGNNEARVNIGVAGVNFIDTYHRTGLYKLPLPAIIGREGAGVVEAVGKDVKDWKVGDRVGFMAQGAYAEKINIPADKLISIPQGLGLKEVAASILQGLTAHYLATSSYQIKKDDFVLVHAGAGGTGALLIQIAKLKGAKVITTVSSDDKAKIAKEAGADHIINYAKEDFLAEVKKITEGKGVRAVYDGVGKDTWENSVKCLGRRGTLVLFGNASGAVPPFDPLLLSANGSLFLTRPTLNDFIADPAEMKERTTELFEWIKQKKVVLRVAKEFSLEQASDAHTFLESRGALGKVLLIVNSKL